MTSSASVAGVIVAGGESRRFGSAKPFAVLGKSTLLGNVIARTEPQVTRLALNVSKRHLERARTDFAGKYDVVPDPVDGRGPLPGVLAGLEWAASRGGVSWLATFPCDTPFLPDDLVPRLIERRLDAQPAVAADSERIHYLCAIWPISLLDKLRAGVESGHLQSVHYALEFFRAEVCRFDSARDAFFNVNTVGDLAIAEDRLRHLGRLGAGSSK